jgi:hypothetical protein
MTADEHYAEAERLIDVYDEANQRAPINGRLSNDSLARILAKAHVHATLALFGEDKRI